jgi:UDP-N-acetylmuramoyl-tripeptide--D-alanyl-D-alanine ligase
MNMQSLYAKFLSVNGITTDTRKIESNTMFFALKGANFNGNEFAAKALELGASFCVIDEEPELSDERFIVVGNVLSTLQELANYHRKQLTIPFIAVTGSNGKTTTKELLHVVLAKKYHVAYTKGNFNNHIGVPLTLLEVNASHEIALIEMGDNHRHEVELLCQIAEPTHGFITNVGKDHLEGFGSFDNNILAKKEVFDYLAQSNGVAFMDANDTLVAEMAQQVKNKVWYGRSGTAAHIQFAGSDPVVRFTSPEGTEYTTQMFGEFNFKNMALAASVGAYFRVEETLIYEALSAYSPTNNRSQVLETDRNTLILDAYNANPSSVEEAISSLAQMQTQKAKWLVLGDMFELGSYSAMEHAAAAKLAVESGVDQVILIGENYFNNAEVEDAGVFASKEEAEEAIKKIAPEGAIILFKGSRGMRLESLVELF